MAVLTITRTDGSRVRLYSTGPNSYRPIEDDGSVTNWTERMIKNGLLSK